MCHTNVKDKRSTQSERRKDSPGTKQKDPLKGHKVILLVLSAPPKQSHLIASMSINMMTHFHHPQHNGIQQYLTV
jgi:hypothetical protein